MCYIRRLTSSPPDPTTEHLLFMTNFNQAKRLQLTPLLSNSAHLGGGSNWMYGGRHERKNLLSDKPIHTRQHSHLHRPSEETSEEKNPHPLFHALSPHHPPIKPPPPSLILSSQIPPPLPRSSPPLFHTSLLLLTVHTLFKYPSKSSRLTVFGYLQIWIDGGFLGSWMGCDG